MQISHPSNTTAAVVHNPQKQTFWQRLRGYVLKPLTWVKALPKRPRQYDLTIIFTVVLILSLVVWLLPWPLSVIIMVLALVVALIFLLRYLS